ncbi:MAG: hypothetical protein OSB29_03940 [Verrucomicrobiota bacterium]|nr:hypothetical protein [Verrucomicrobiota bacterium]
MTNKIFIAFGLALFGVCVIVILKDAPARSEPEEKSGEPTMPEPGGQKRIKYPEYDRATGLIKSLLTGDTAVQVKGGLMLITGMRLETYRYDGASRNVDLIIVAPECLFSFRTHVASSDGLMTLRRADGDAFLSGRGFEWHQRESILTISNNVRTVTRKGFSIDE